MTDEEFRNRLSSTLPGKPLGALEEAVFDLFKTGSLEQRATLWEMYRPMPQPQRLTPEQHISRALRLALAHVAEGAAFLEASERSERLAILLGLEHFLPSALAEVYPYWKHESLDGFHFLEARKTGPDEAELFGVCILISDQTVTPVHVRLRVSPSEDKIDWMECRLGKRGTGEGNMERVPFLQWRNHPLIGLPRSSDLIDWVYQITQGERT